MEITVHLQFFFVNQATHREGTKPNVGPCIEAGADLGAGQFRQQMFHIGPLSAHVDGFTLRTTALTKRKIPIAARAAAALCSAVNQAQVKVAKECKMVASTLLVARKVGQALCGADFAFAQLTQRARVDKRVEADGSLTCPHGGRRTHGKALRHGFCPPWKAVWRREEEEELRSDPTHTVCRFTVREERRESADR